MADDEKAEAGATSPEAAGSRASDGEDMLAVLREIRDAAREASERQGRFMWLLIPIFALLCVLVVLALFR